MIIETEYKGPTNPSPGRVLARTRTGEYARVVVPWNHELDTSDNHDAALRALCAKVGVSTHDWSRHHIEGGDYLYSRGGIKVSP